MDEISREMRLSSIKAIVGGDFNAVPQWGRTRDDISKGTVIDWLAQMEMEVANTDKKVLP